MIDIYLPIKPLSVNDAWQGKRFKTPAYKAYEKHLMIALPSIKKLPDAPYRVYFEFGVNSLFDYDNGIKSLQDIVAKRYGFNDRYILEAHIKKVVVKKGGEYFKVRLETLT